MNNFEQDMKDYDTEWENFEPREGSGDFGPQMPDGQHQALLVDISVRQRQTDEHWQLYLKWQNPRGSVRAWRDLDHEVGRSIAMNDLWMLGYKGSWQGVNEAIGAGQFANLVCNINVKTKPGDTRDFTDVYLNGVLGTAEDPSLFAVQGDLASEAAPAPAADDDIPF